MPDWKSDFPVASDEDGYVTRRELTKFLGLTSLSFVIGTLAAVIRKWLWRPADAGALSIARIDDVPVGGYRLFNYPTPDDPCILVRLEESKFAAFNQRCTHLSCPVHFDAANRQLVCPCHHGFFDAEDGRVIAGPPRRELDRLEVSVEKSKVWVKHA
jgi:nitrite reductase/ring-hydroxylating ferredoxin subunit